MSSQVTPTKPYNQYATQPKPEEALIQSGGYTHLSQIGSAVDLPTLSQSPVWRKVSHFEETVATVLDYLFATGSRYSGLTTEDEAVVTDSKNPTPLAYLGVQQILGGRIPSDLSLVRNILSSIGKPLDDRKLQLEDVVSWLSTSGKKRHDGPNKLVNSVQNQFISLLWNDLNHPPTVNLNPKYRYRAPDGRNNNLTGNPLLGAANQAYSRSVKPVHPTAPYIAEPEDMFDSILRRPAGWEGFKPHPAGISSLLFGFANLIIHDLFWSNSGPEVKVSASGPESNDSKENSGASNEWQNLTSSYLSLDPLYGVNEKQQKMIRNLEELGRGVLYNDTFASNRLLVMPPASCALLVLFSRNHNRIAQKLLEINARGNWTTDVEKLSPDQKQQQDDEIFGTARHINCGYYVNIILHDYLQSILNTIQADSDWVLDPRTPIKNILGRTPTAGGNSVSVEFNAIYRWHAPISWSQTQWIEEKFSKGLPSRNWDDMTGAGMKKAIDMLQKELNAQDGSDPRNWKLSKYEVKLSDNGQPELTSTGVYERDSETGKFKDEDLARILKDSTCEVAGAFGARHVPAVMRWVECQGMRTALKVWNTCTLNEFRHFLGLKEFETFEEWNSDPSIASAMEHLVGQPANIPLHVGLHGEEAKDPRLGSGLCLNYTNSRAILSDAVALVRGDRFYTDSATLDTMTDWGIQDCQSDVEEGSYGGVLQRLIRNNLPNQYVFNDFALLFPFLVPKRSYSIMERISHQQALNYSLQPQLPDPSVGYKKVKSGEATLVYELSNTPEVEIERMRLLFGLPHMNSNIKIVYTAVEHVVSKQNTKLYQKFIQSRIQQCSAKRSPVSEDKTVDIMRDVINPLISGWLAHIFGLVETGTHSQQLLLCTLSDIYLYLTEPISYKSRSSARVASSALVWQIKYHIQASSCSIRGLLKKGASIITVGALDFLEDSIKIISGQHPIIKNVHADAASFYRALRVENTAQKTPLSTDELAADCLRAISTLAYTIVNGTAHALDHLMPPAYTLPREMSLAKESLEDLVNHHYGNDSNAQQEGYLKFGLEGARLSHWNAALRGMIVEPKHQERRYDRPIGMIDEQFWLDRDISQYSRLLDVEGNGLDIFKNILPIIIHQVFLLPQIRRAPGHQGKLDKVMITGSVASIPTMHIRYDGTNIHPEP